MPRRMEICVFSIGPHWLLLWCLDIVILGQAWALLQGLKCLQPLLPGSPVLSLLLLSPPSHQGHPRPAHRDPVLLFLSSWPILSLSPVLQCLPSEVYQMSCVPPTTFCLHLIPPSHARRSVCGPQPITCHDHNLPLSSLQGYSSLSAAVP